MTEGAVSLICPRAQQEGVRVLLTDSFIKVPDPVTLQHSGRLSVSQKRV